MFAEFKITFQRNVNKTSRFVVVEGTSSLLRTAVSSHRTYLGAMRAASKWKAPAVVVVVDRKTGEVVGDPN